MKNGVHYKSHSCHLVKRLLFLTVLFSCQLIALADSSLQRAIDKLSPSSNVTELNLSQYPSTLTETLFIRGGVNVRFVNGTLSRGEELKSAPLIEIKDNSTLELGASSVLRGEGILSSAVLNCPNLVGGAGTKYDNSHLDVAYAHIDGGMSNPGYFTDKNAPHVEEAYAVYTDDGMLTFYYDMQRNSREGTTYSLNTGTNYPDWHTDHRKEIKKVVFNSSFSEARPTSTYSWFGVYNNYEESILSEIVGIEYLNTSLVTNMSCMFFRCVHLTGLDVSHFDTSKVEDMRYMFYECRSVASLDVSHFDTSKVTDMTCMFYNCRSITSLDVSHFDTSMVTSMYCMFLGCHSLTNLDLSFFDTQRVTNMYAMFNGCNNLTSLNISHFDTSNVITMSIMFAHCYGLKNLDISYFDTSNVIGMESMFTTCTALATIYVGKGWNTDKVTKSQGMFLNCPNLVGGAGTKYDVNHVDATYAHIDGGTSNPGYFTDKNAPAEKEAYAVYTDDGTLTFYYDNQKGSRSGTKYNLNTGTNYPAWYSDHRLDIKKVAFNSSFAEARPTSTYSWFAVSRLIYPGWGVYFEKSNISEIVGIEYLNTSKVTNMSEMFGNCERLESLDVSHFDTSKVTDMSGMFYGCSGLTSIDVSHFNTSNVTDMLRLFSGCSSLTTIFVGDKWNTEKVTYSGNMFLSCTNIVGGKGTRYDANHVDATYAHIDGGPNNPGYFTDINEPKVSNEEDLQKLLDGIDESSGTEEHPFIVPIASNGMTVGGDVNIDKEVHLLFDGGTSEPLSVNFVGGVISINDKNSSLAFNNAIMTNSTMARGQGMATATVGSGGIVNGGKLLLTGCTVADGLITNSSSVYIDGTTAVSGMTNRLGGRIYITSPMTKTVSFSISGNDIETGIPAILGGNGYTLTAEDATHISIALPAAYEWKYDASKQAIVIIKKGDSNDDNTIDVADIATIISYMAGDTKALDLKSVDVNGDGVVDVADIASVISIMAGK